MVNDRSTILVSQQLLLNVAEQMKLPLLQIARFVEESQLTSQDNLSSIKTIANSSLQLIDNYVLGVRLSFEGQALEIEPVSVSAVLYDSGQALDDYAKKYGIELELSIAGRYGTVMANKLGLQTALVSLGMALIESLPAIDNSQLKLQLATHRCRYGIVAGLYTNTEQLTTDALRQGRQLYGYARQPLSNVSHTAGAGIFVADSIFKAMKLKLQVSRHQGRHGLGTVLQPNNQIQLV